MTNPNRYSFIRPEKSFIFYGYFIAIFGTLGVLASIPGQTIGVGTFTDPVKDAIGLDRLQFSIAYFVGTIVSSFFLHKAGQWFDKYGARWLAFFAALGLAFSLYLCSQADVITDGLSDLLNVSHFLLPAVVMTVLFFLLRFSGQGVLTLASRNMIMKWFNHYRGRVNAFSAIVVSLGFSSSPLWISKLIDAYGWKNAWLVLAAGVFLLSFVFMQFFRDNPEAHNLLMDGRAVSESEKDDFVNTTRQFTLKEARGTRAFWMFSLSISFYSFFVTGLTFNIISIFADSGYSKDQAVAIFLPMSAVSIIVSLVANYASDWISLKYLQYLNILGGIMAAFGLVFLNIPFGVLLLIGGAGIMGGLFTVLNTITWPRYYGRKFLGEISGKTLSIIVLASALGPPFFSLSKKYLFNYSGIGVLAIVFLVIISIGSIKAKSPQE